MMSEMYDSLAPIYDVLNQEIDYERWAEAVSDALAKFSYRPVKTIADIGCGTGSMTLALARRGYTMLGIDLSPEMLNVAYQRAGEGADDLPVTFIMQDMTALDLGAPVDAVICALDGINHLPGRDALSKCFQSIGEWLSPGGLFLFDLNSQYKFENIYADEVYTFETEDAFCVWQNEYHPATKFCNFYITLFHEEGDGRYTRTDTMQREYYFPRRTIENTLKASGMQLVACAGDLDGSAIQSTDERWYFIARKEG